IRERPRNGNHEEVVQVIVSGTVTDGDGTPLPGANILVQGTTNGTQADFDGNFSISVEDENAILVVSYIGFTTQKITIGKKRTFTVTLLPDSTHLDEIVVVAYGSQKRENLTAAVTTVNLDNIDSKPITNLAQAFVGMAAGVSATQVSSQPGSSGSTILIRGQNTLGDANNTPLVVIDGAVGGSLDDINPSDVASISMLKDASSTAIYGARAAAGVILITTKRGKVGKISVNYDVYSGWDEATELPNVISNSETYMRLVRERTNNYTVPSDAIIQEFIDDGGANPELYPNTDWYETVMGGKAFMQSHRLSINGGSEEARVAASINYLDQDGLVENTGNEKIGFRLNFDSKVSDKIAVGMNIYGNYAKRTSPGGNIQDVLSTVNSTVPYMVPISADGRFGYDGYTNSGSGNALSILNSRLSVRESNAFIGKMFATYDILPNLKLTSSVTVNNDQINTQSIQKKFLRYHFIDDSIDVEGAANNTFSQSDSRNRIITLNTILNYDFDIGDQHFISVLGGYSQEENRWDTSRASGNDLIDESIFVLDGPQDQTSFQIGGNKTFDNLRSYFGRVNYNFDSKYLFEASFRYDGSSKFRKDLRWGFFPSVSVGWNMHRESFLENVDFISTLKLRSSVGKVGNNQSLGLYSSISTLNFGANYSFDEVIEPGVFLSELANPQLVWEETTTYGVGMDFGLFNNKITGEIDVFKSRTDGILRRIQAPLFGGIITAPFENLAIVDNKGYELALNYRNSEHALKFSAGLTLSHSENKIVAFNDGQDQEIFGSYINKVGYPIGSVYTYESEGIFRTQNQIDNHASQPQTPQIGDLIYKDQLTVDTNNDGVFDAVDGIINSDDRKILDPPAPKINTGLNLIFEYKGFDFNVLLQGSLGSRDFLTASPARPFAFPGGRGATGKEWLNAYHETRNPDLNTNLPRLDETSGNFINSTYWMHDFSFLRFKTLQIGYRLPENAIGHIGLSKARLYLNGQNMFTIENLPHFDPESVGRVYPLTKTITLGLQLMF
ncbi:TonB-dependent receptor, partial [Arenibacter sp. ARW7G5Y1]|uniref:SusC/RagA family TonB-linked outer membrane protein n=1 Tax=Arenibacter sp. ARW7G5Y1 TaxID=2135619 RepID=UPI000D838E33